jgi:hypothetical protein
MKNQHEHGWMMGPAVALAGIALCITASAQRVGQRGGPAVSLRGDTQQVRGPLAAGSPADGGTVRVDLERELQLTFQVAPYTGAAPRRGKPAFQDLKRSLRLSGAPGSTVVIHVDLPASPGTKKTVGRGAVIAGVIGADGSFVVDLPDELDLAGLAAQGAVIETRVVTAVVDLGAAEQEAFATWSITGSLPEPPRAQDKITLTRRRGHTQMR